MSASSKSESLLDQLTKAVASVSGEHIYAVQVLRSKPRRSYALFPYASNRKTTKIWQEEVLVVLSEERDVPVESPAAEGAASEPPATASGTRRAMVPIVGLEASIYTIPATSSSILYISKVDTTGLQPTSEAPNPTRSLVVSFLAFHFAHPPHGTTRLRVHIFAKSQPQYLFPGSVENKSKKVLDDKGLIRWWKSCLDRATIQHSSVEGATAPQLFYLIPGLSYVESLPYVPSSTLPSAPKWTYSHPNATLPSLLHPSTTAPAESPITDHIPAFPDDPKSRFITSLTSSAVASSGNEHDYDDVMISQKSATLTTGSAASAHVNEVEVQREKEGRRMRETEGGIEGWWEQMAWRQECCSGVLVGFFVVGIEPVAGGKGAAESISSKAPRPAPMAVDHALFTRLWSQFHNVDYALANVVKCASMASKWEQDVERSTRAEAEGGIERPTEVDAATLQRTSAAYEKEVRRQVAVNNPLLPTAEKRPAEAPVVNKMVPRKKKPKVA